FFMTDPDLKVLEYSKNIPDILTLSKRKLNNITFTKLLSKDSKNDFEQLIHIIESPGKPDYQERKLVLEFKNSQALLIKSECFIHPMKSGSEPRLFITCSKILYRNQFLEKTSKAPRKNGRTHLHYPSEVEVKMLESKRELIQKIYIWIKKNLDKPLPDLGEKATEWGASKSTIRKEFKKRYGSGIHTFHRNQRLETAALMILETEQSIKRISLNYGFKSLPHFTNVFKKKFGCSPSQYRKLNPRKDLREQSIHTTNKIFNDPGEPLHIHGKADE
ncbi:MAG TPA: AraC family transcriptional regulator, partial [Salinimicrobium sp.]|nr:AraC family transcriptional regulator [Salinimicrobium sp.]